MFLAEALALSGKLQEAGKFLHASYLHASYTPLSYTPLTHKPLTRLLQASYLHASYTPLSYTPLTHLDAEWKAAGSRQVAQMFVKCVWGLKLLVYGALSF